MTLYYAVPRHQDGVVGNDLKRPELNCRGFKSHLLFFCFPIFYLWIYIFCGNATIKSSVVSHRTIFLEEKNSITLVSLPHKYIIIKQRRGVVKDGERSGKWKRRRSPKSVTKFLRRWLEKVGCTLRRWSIQHGTKEALRLFTQMPRVRISVWRVTYVGLTKKNAPLKNHH